MVRGEARRGLSGMLVAKKECFMGVIGPEILDNDFAADAHAEFLGLMEDGVSPRRAVRRMVKDMCLEDDDAYVTYPFWLGLALAQVESGRLTRRVRKVALHIIDSGVDLAVWEAEVPDSAADRRAALAELREQITGPQIRPTRMTRPPKDGLDWEAGDVFAYRLKSGMWTALRLDEVEDGRIREGIFELCDLSLERLPTDADIAQASLRLSRYAKTEIAKIHEDRDEVARAYRNSSDELRTARMTDWDTNIVPSKIQRAHVSGARISLVLSEFAAAGSDRLHRITRGVERHPPGWFSYSAYADDLDTVLEREFGLA